MPNVSNYDDSQFGPVYGCRGDFDFSLVFEHILLPTAPSGLFLLLAIARLSVLSATQQTIRKVVVGSRWRWANITVACYGTVEVSLLVLWIHAYPGPYGKRASLAAAVLRIIDVLALGGPVLAQAHSKITTTFQGLGPGAVSLDQATVFDC